MGHLVLILLLVMCSFVGFANGIYPEDIDDPMGLGQEANLLILLYLLRRRLQRPTRWYWVCPTNSRRQQQGAWDNLISELAQEELEKFTNFHRLTVDQFITLLEKIRPTIERRAVVREPIPSGLRLSLIEIPCWW